jgi:hypothetical protein
LLKLSRDAKLLRNLLVVYIIADIFLTPIGGLETRAPSNITTLGFATLGLLFLGLALNVSSLALLFRNPRRSRVLALIGSALYFPAALADYTGLFANLPRPLGIAYLEVVEGVVALGLIILAVRLRKQNSESQTSSGTAVTQQ